MAFCNNCGNEVPAGTGFCAKCGQQVSASGTAQPAAQPAAAGTPQPAAQPAAAGTPQPAAQPGAAPAGQLTSNVAGMLCYVLTLITGILFLVLEPYNRDPFVRFHAFQAIFFFVAAMVLSIVMVVVLVIPVVGWILYLFVCLGLMGVWAMLMFQAYQNNKWKLPVIGDLAEKQS